MAPSEPRKPFAAVRVERDAAVVAYHALDRALALRAESTSRLHERCGAGRTDSGAPRCRGAQVGTLGRGRLQRTLPEQPVNLARLHVEPVQLDLHEVEALQLRAGKHQHYLVCFAPLQRGRARGSGRGPLSHGANEVGTVDLGPLPSVRLPNFPQLHTSDSAPFRLFRLFRRCFCRIREVVGSPSVRA